ncbi:MAG: hypothetical protein SFV32_07345 [Opitutaceae bacterium]|nr:hypothetical protein [Opitutaceae bacterium]
MRPLFLAILFIFAHASTFAEVSIVRIWTEYRDAASFERMGEFFTGKEKLGGDLVVRSRSDDRDGYYLLLRVKNRGDALAGVRTELNAIFPSSPKARSFTHFPAISLPRGSQVVHVGITGDDWPEGLSHPVAWELRMFDSEGRLILRDASYLWGPP